MLAASALPALLLMLSAPEWAEPLLANDIIIAAVIVGLILLAPVGLHFADGRGDDVLRIIARWAWIPALGALILLALNMKPGSALFDETVQRRLIVALFLWIGLALFAIYIRNDDAISYWQHLADQNPLAARIVLLIVAALPMLVVLILIMRYAINVPFSDEWRRIQYYMQGSLLRLDFGAFWGAKRGVQRNFVPEIIATAIFHLTRANQLPVVYLNWIANIGIAALITLVYARLSGRPRWVIVVIPVSLILFTLANQRYWLLTLLLHVHIMWLCVIGALAILFLMPRGIPALVLVALLAFIASTSATEGNFVWPLLFPALWIAGYRERWVYGLFALLMVALYGMILSELVTTNLNAPAAGPDAQVIRLFGQKWRIQNPTQGSGVNTNLVSLLDFTLGYLGSGLVTGTGAVFSDWMPHVFGGMGLYTFGALTVIAWRGGIERLRPAFPWITLAAFVVLTAILTGMGRAEAGTVQNVIALRYVSRSSMFWIALLLLGLSMVDTRPEFAPLDERLMHSLTAFVIVLILTLYTHASLRVLTSDVYPDVHAELVAAQACLKTDPPDLTCSALTGIGDITPQQVEALIRLQPSFLDP